MQAAVGCLAVFVRFGTGFGRTDLERFCQEENRRLNPQMYTNKQKDTPRLLQGLRGVSKYDIVNMPLRRQGAAQHGRRLVTLPERG